jgi:molecular chaperone IbpA
MPSGVGLTTLAYTKENTMTTDIFNTLALDSFRRVFFNMDLTQARTSIGYPPYNVVQHNDSEYTIELAVAGFAKEHLDITLEENNVLHIVGNNISPDESDKTYLIRGLASRGFVKKFTLADSIVVHSTRLENGVLSINLRRVVPESKTRKLEIL